MSPDPHVTLRVLPPSLMTGALRAGEIDGFIAGEPWSSVAVAEGLGEIAAAGAAIWRRGVEKVLATRADWAEANPEALDRLVRAVTRAAAWCDDPANRDALADLLALPAYVGQPPALIAQALAGRMPLRQGGESVDIPDFLVFHRGAANFPWRSQALWIYSQFVRWKMLAASPESERGAAGVFRSDLYRRALAGEAIAMPGASMKVEGALGEPLGAGAYQGSLTLAPDRFFDGRTFDPDDIAGYLGALSN